MTEPNKDKVILLVDDDDDFRLQMRIPLEASGYRVVEADSAAEAEKLLKDRTPDLAIIDLMMEELDAGFTLAYHMDKQHPEMPVILVTGVASETGIEFDASTREERSWIKADKVLHKPIRFEQLRGEVEKLLEESGS